MVRSKIVYADCDRRRLKKVTEILAGAGFVVWPCSGEVLATPQDSFGTPGLVLLCQELDKDLGSLAKTLWPGVPTMILNDFGDYRQLPLRIESTLRKDK